MKNRLRRIKYSIIRKQQSPKTKFSFFRFRRFYISHKMPFHRRWLTRVLRREFGITKDSFR